MNFLVPQNPLSWKVTLTSFKKRNICKIECCVKQASRLCCRILWWRGRREDMSLHKYFCQKEHTLPNMCPTVELHTIWPTLPFPGTEKYFLSVRLASSPSQWCTRKNGYRREPLIQRDGSSLTWAQPEAAFFPESISKMLYLW